MIDVRVLSNVNGLEGAVIIATEVYIHTVRSVRISGNDRALDEQRDSLKILIIEFQSSLLKTVDSFAAQFSHKAIAILFYWLPITINDDL